MEAGLRDMFAVERAAPKAAAKASPIGELPTGRRSATDKWQNPQSAILARCSFIFNVVLKTVDESVHRRLQQHGIEPQLYLLRWLRLLFCREFQLEDTLHVWDAIFTDAFCNSARSSLDYSQVGSGAAVVRAEAASTALPLVDYFAVAMIQFIRKDVLDGDENDCLQQLLKYPPIESIQTFRELAERLRAGKGTGGSESLRLGSLGSFLRDQPLAAGETARQLVASGPLGSGDAQKSLPGPLGDDNVPVPARAASQGVAFPQEPDPCQTAPLQTPETMAGSTGNPADGGLLDATMNLFDVGKEALFSAKQKVTQLAGEVGKAGMAGNGGGSGLSSRPAAAVVADMRRGLFDSSSSQVSELQQRLAAVEQERDNIKKKASEFIQAKRSEWNARVKELEDQLATSRARVRDLEAGELSSGLKSEAPESALEPRPAGEDPELAAAHARSEELAVRCASLEQQLEAETARAVELERKLEAMEGRLQESPRLPLT